MHQQTSLSTRIWQLTWPAIISNISIPLLGLADAGILGHLDSARYLAAVAIGSAVLSFVYWGFSFLRMGTTGLVAREVGAKRNDKALLVLARSLVLALGLAALVLLLRPLWLHFGLAFMGATGTSYELAYSYSTIRSYSAPAALMTYAIIGWFIGSGNTRWPMVILVFTNGLNVALDYLFILKLGWGSNGAAWATVVAEYSGWVLAIAAVASQHWSALKRALHNALSKSEGYGALLTANRHLLVRTMTLLFSFAFFTRQGNQFGADVLAANAILIQLLMLASYGLDGFAYAAEALTGQAAGAMQRKRFYRAVWLTGCWCMATAVVFSVVYGLLGGVIFSWLTSLPAVLELLSRYQPWVVLIPLLAAPSYLIDGVFIGTATTRPMMWTMLICTFLIYLPLWYITRDYGNHGLWFAFAVFSAARGLTLGLVFIKRMRREEWV